MLPEDPNILLSYVNTKLRDEFGSLDSLCQVLGVEPGALAERLAGLGYAYDGNANQFRPV